MAMVRDAMSRQHPWSIAENGSLTKCACSRDQEGLKLESTHEVENTFGLGLMAWFAVLDLALSQESVQSGILCSVELGLGLALLLRASSVCSLNRDAVYALFAGHGTGVFVVGALFHMTLAFTVDVVCLVAGSTSSR